MPLLLGFCGPVLWVGVPIVVAATGGRSWGTIWRMWASDKLSGNLAYQ